MSAPEFRLSIDVTVRGSRAGGEGYCTSAIVCDALQELVNRLDFRNGTIQPGRVITHHRDHSDAIVTVDVATLRVVGR